MLVDDEPSGCTGVRQRQKLRSKYCSDMLVTMSLVAAPESTKDKSFAASIELKPTLTVLVHKRLLVYSSDPQEGITACLSSCR